jgi:histidine triad (HIT) family protein
VLVIPRDHIGSAAELTPAQDHLWGRLLHVAQSIADDEGVAEKGYRLVTNIGRDGGQAVHHLHLHVLGGRRMTWPPG